MTDIYTNNKEDDIMIDATLDTNNNKHTVTWSKRNKYFIAYPTTYGCSSIRNGSSGNFYDVNIGSKRQDYFFKVKLLHNKRFTQNENSTFFYHNPDEFTQHQQIPVSKKNRLKWENRNKNKTYEN